MINNYRWGASTRLCTYDLPRLCTCDSPRLCTYDFVVDAIRMPASCGYPIFTGNFILPPRGIFPAKFPQTGVPGKQGSKQGSKQASKQASQPSKQASQQASQPASQQASKPASQPASQPASKQGSQRANQASKQASQQASKQASKPARQPARQPATVPLYHWNYCCRGGSVVMVGARIPRMGKWYVQMAVIIINVIPWKKKQSDVKFKSCKEKPATLAIQVCMYIYMYRLSFRYIFCGYLFAHIQQQQQQQQP